jgi:hypothetical protein
MPKRHLEAFEFSPATRSKLASLKKKTGLSKKALLERAVDYAAKHPKIFSIVL